MGDPAEHRAGHKQRAGSQRHAQRLRHEAKIRAESQAAQAERRQRQQHQTLAAAHQTQLAREREAKAQAAACDRRDQQRRISSIRPAQMEQRLQQREQVGAAHTEPGLLVQQDLSLERSHRFG